MGVRVPDDPLAAVVLEAWGGPLMISSDGGATKLALFEGRPVDPARALSANAGTPARSLFCMETHGTEHLLSNPGYAILSGIAMLFGVVGGFVGQGPFAGLVGLVGWRSAMLGASLRTG